MSLKEQMEFDLQDGGVWFNEGDFADWHNVNGARVLCIMDSMVTKPTKVGRSGGGVHRGSSLVSIRAKDFTRCPKPGETITIDGARYQIVNVTDDVGVYVIEYGRYDNAKLRRPNP